MLETFTSYEPQLWLILFWSFIVWVGSIIGMGFFLLVSTVGKSVGWLTVLSLALMAVSVWLTRISGIVVVISAVLWVFARFL